jgi:predicted  nucleic acid-binding Zn-ribbon protein
MQQATNLNVQSKAPSNSSGLELTMKHRTDHVEHFKQELTREVVAMTQQVRDLHQQKQGLEHDIAELFAFYTKQRQTTAHQEVCGGIPCN